MSQKVFFPSSIRVQSWLHGVGSAVPSIFGFRAGSGHRIGWLLQPLLHWLVLVSVAANPEASQLRIRTDPPDARIFHNGRLQDTAPLTLTDLPPGDHLISAQARGYHEERATVTIEPGQRKALDLELRPVTGLVLIHSTPAGADITINGAHRGKTPLLLTDLRIGNHRAKATHPAYLPMEIDLVVPDRTPKKIDLELRPDAGRVRFESTPEGAQVRIDGTLEGMTPCTIDRIPSGAREVEIRIEGHQIFRQTLQLAAGDERDIQVRLDPLPGSLELTSIPDGARIYINDERRGETPLGLDGVTPGDYHVRAELRGFAPETATLTVGNDTVTSREFRLERDSGTIILTTEPAGVRVLLDGVEVGRTLPGESDVLSVPFTMDYVSAGERMLELAREGYHSLTKRLTIEVGKTVTHHESLRRRFIPDTRVRIGEGAGGIRTGIITQRYPNGDIVLETRPGIFQTIESDRILEIETIRDGQEP